MYLGRGTVTCGIRERVRRDCHVGVDWETRAEIEGPLDWVRLTTTDFKAAREAMAVQE